MSRDGDRLSEEQLGDWLVAYREARHQVDRKYPRGDLTQVEWLCRLDEQLEDRFRAWWLAHDFLWFLAEELEE